MSTLSLRVGDQHATVDLEGDRVRIGDSTLTVESVASGVYRVVSDSGQQSIAVAGSPERPWVFVDGIVAQVEIEAGGRARPGRSTGSHDLTAPMPATVVRVAVEPGAAVVKGETLLVLEAMKMEVPVRAPADGIVKVIHCKAGDLVQPGIALLEFT